MSTLILNNGYVMYTQEGVFIVPCKENSKEVEKVT